MKSDVETRKWLNSICKIHEGDCVEFTYQGQRKTGKVKRETIKGTQYLIVHPAGGSYSVWREYIHKKIPRVVWAGIAESLIQHGIQDGYKPALKQAQLFYDALEILLKTANRDQSKHALVLLDAVKYACEELEKIFEE